MVQGWRRHPVVERLVQEEAKYRAKVTWPEKVQVAEVGSQVVDPLRPLVPQVQTGVVIYEAGVTFHENEFLQERTLSGLADFVGIYEVVSPLVRLNLHPKG